MAGNSTSIDQVVDPIAIQQFNQLQASGKELRAELVLLLETAIRLNASLGGSTPASFAKNLKASTDATAQIIANNNKQIENEAKKAAKQEEIYNKYLVMLSKQEAARQQAQAKQDAADAKEIAKAQEKAAKLQAIADAAARRRRVVTENTAAEIAAAEALRAEEERLIATTVRATAANEVNAVSLRDEAAAAATAEASSEAYRISQTRLGAQSVVTAGEIGVATAATNANNSAATSSLAGIGQGLTRGLGYLRTLAYILPGIGIAGIFNVIIKGVTALYEAIFSGREKLDIFVAQLKNMNEVLKSTTFKNTVSEIKELTTNFQLAKNGVIDKNGVLKEYNETLGKTTGYIDDFNTAEKITLERGQKVLQLIILKTAAQGLLTKAAEKASERALELNKTDLESANFADRVKGGLNFKVPGLFESATDVRKREAKETIENQKKLGAARRAQNAIDLKKEEDQFTKAFESLQKEAAKYAKDNKLSFFGDEKKPVREKKGPKDFTNTDLLEFNKLQLEEQKKNLQAILDDENIGYQTRLDALKQFQIVSQRLLENGRDIELSQTGLREQQKLNIQLDYQIKSRDLTAQGNEGMRNLAKQELQRLVSENESYEKIILQGIEDTTSAQTLLIQTQADKELAIVADKHKRGLITEKQYRKQLKDIQDEANLNIAGQNAFSAQGVLETKQAAEDRDVTAAKKLGATPAQIAKIRANSGVGAAQSNLNKAGTTLSKAFNTSDQGDSKTDDISTSQFRKGVADEAIQAINLVKDARDKAFEAQIEQLQKIGEQIDRNAALEKDAVGRSLDTQSNKARQVAIIDAQTAAKKENLARKEAELKHKQAVANKEATVAQLIIQGTLAVVTALTAGPILGVILAVGTAALVAAELAIAIATPIPQYARGTGRGGHKGGLAIVGDGGGPERITEPGRPAYYSPVVATLTSLPRGTVVEPYKMLPVTPRWESSASAGNRAVVDAIDRLGRKEAPRPSRTKLSGWVESQRQADAWRSYSNNHFK